jgi:DNA-directed RNA polymerase subunit RPC12/RpoP
MRHEDVHEILYKERKPEPKEDDLPVCIRCGQRFLGFFEDDLCADCEMELKQIAEALNFGDIDLLRPTLKQQ